MRKIQLRRNIACCTYAALNLNYKQAKVYFNNAYKSNNNLLYYVRKYWFVSNLSEVSFECDVMITNSQNWIPTKLNNFPTVNKSLYNDRPTEIKAGSEHNTNKEDKWPWGRNSPTTRYCIILKWLWILWTEENRTCPLDYMAAMSSDRVNCIMRKLI